MADKPCSVSPASAYSSPYCMVIACRCALGRLQDRGRLKCSGMRAGTGAHWLQPWAAFGGTYHCHAAIMEPESASVAMLWAVQV